MGVHLCGASHSNHGKIACTLRLHCLVTLNLNSISDLACKMNAHRISDYVSGGSRSSSRNWSGQPIGIGQKCAPHISDIYKEGNTICFMARSSQTIAQLTDTIIDMHYSMGCPPNSHGYVLGGYVDITHRDVIPIYELRNSRSGYRRTVRYEEVTFQMTVTEAMTKLVEVLVAATRRLREEGIRPCFATIPPADLAKWNDYRLYCGKTAGLIHESQYEEMQMALNATIVGINGFICRLNHFNAMYTPYLAGTCLRTKTVDNIKKYITQSHKLFDGVHADDTLIEEWASKLEKSIRKNRTDGKYLSRQNSSILSNPLTDEQVYAFLSD